MPTPATWLDALHQRIPFGFGEEQQGALVRQRDVMVQVLNGLAADGIDVRAAVRLALGDPERDGTNKRRLLALVEV